jgi:hypothetical protein
LPHGIRTPVALACAPSTPPAPVATIRFLAPPSRLQPPWGLPARGCSHASARGGRQTCAWLTSEVSGPTAPFPARRRRIGSPGVFCPYGTFELGGSGSPGEATPRHLPPSGFDYPLDGLRPSEPGDGPSTATAPMGFALQGLAPPGQRYPSRGLASPVVSPPSPQAGRPRLQRLTPTGKGPDSSPPAGGDGRTLPSWAFAPPRLSPSPPWDRLPGPSPSCPSGRKCSLRFHFRAGLQGIVSDESGWSLSRLPAFLGFRALLKLDTA